MPNVEIDGPEVVGPPIDTDPPGGKPGAHPAGPGAGRGRNLLLGAVVVLAVALTVAAFLSLRSPEPEADPATAAGSEATPSPDGSETAEAAGSLEVEVPESSIGSEAQPTESSDSSQPAPPVAAGDERPISVVGMSSLSNVRLRNNRAAYRFTADRDGAIESLRLYFIVNTSRAGYAAGNGGTVEVTVAPDDGSGLPDESGLFPGRFEATFDLENGAFSGGDDRGDFIRDTLLGNWRFSEPIPVTEGQSYHIIFRNSDPSPATNFVSLDLVIDLLAETDTSGQPLPSPARRTDFGFLEDREGDKWFKADVHSSGHWRTPIFEVTYAEGGTQGQGFMQYEAGDTFELAGSSAIRTTIELDRDRTVSELSARVSHNQSGSVILELTTIDGEVLRGLAAPADGTQNYRGATWVTGTVEPITLEAGTTYALVVRPGDGYAGTVVPLQAGLAYGFSPDSVFPYGTAQISRDGSNWEDWRGGLFYQSISIK